MWQRARSTSKVGFDNLWRLADKLGAPVNKLSNKLGSEAFWPTTLDKECDKAARILRSFCKDGFYEEVQSDNGQEQEVEEHKDEPKKRYSKVLKKIPADVIRNAKGLAVFTTMRTGLWISGAGGSGVLVARLPDGKWSPPSGIMLHTAGVGFLVGVDIYDCVVVLNTDEAVSAFSKVRCTLGGEMTAVAGPVGIGGLVDTEVHKRHAPIFTYLKSRGFYAGVQLDGTIVIERTDENERFYGRKVHVADILAGKVSSAPIESQKLIQTIKMAQGDTDVDPSMLPLEAAPSDFDIASGQVFGVPDRNDPDPYGFAALEQEGLVIREAGTNKRASRESFQFMPSPTSPLFNAFNPGGNNRASADLDSRRSSWRTSMTDRSAQTIDMATQTDIDSPVASAPPTLPPRPQSATYVASMAGIPEVETIDQKIGNHVRTESTNTAATETAEKPSQPIKNPEEITTSSMQTQTTPPPVATAETSPIKEPVPETVEATTPATETVKDQEAAEPKPHTTDGLTEFVRADDDADADDEDSSDDDDVVFHDVIQTSAPRIITASPQLITKARLVNVIKPPPPALPSRNPNRTRAAKTSSVPGSEHLGDAPHDPKDQRPLSRGSSVYSLPKDDDVPSSAKGTESLVSVSSAEHGDLVHAVTKEAVSPPCVDAETFPEVVQAAK